MFLFILKSGLSLMIIQEVLIVRIIEMNHIDVHSHLGSLILPQTRARTVDLPFKTQSIRLLIISFISRISVIRIENLM